MQKWHVDPNLPDLLYLDPKLTFSQPASVSARLTPLHIHLSQLLLVSVLICQTDMLGLPSGY